MSSGAFSPAYRIETERFVARCWSPSDASMVREAIDASDAHLRKWVPFMNEEPRSLAETAKRLRMLRSKFDSDVEYRYGLFDHDERAVIGGVGLFKRVGPRALEVGYWVSKPYDGKGFASECTSAVLRLAFEIERVDRVEVHCDSPNTASARIPEKLGFTHEATLARRTLEGVEGAEFDLMIWTMFFEQYPGSPASRLPVKAFDCLGQPFDLPDPD